jgi:hypothetical protein
MKLMPARPVVQKVAERRAMVSQSPGPGGSERRAA